MFPLIRTMDQHKERKMDLINWCIGAHTIPFRSLQSEETLLRKMWGIISNLLSNKTRVKTKHLSFFVKCFSKENTQHNLTIKEQHVKLSATLCTGTPRLIKDNLVLQSHLGHLGCKCFSTETSLSVIDICCTHATILRFLMIKHNIFMAPLCPISTTMDE